MASSSEGYFPAEERGAAVFRKALAGGAAYRERKNRFARVRSARSSVVNLGRQHKITWWVCLLPLFSTLFSK